MAGFSPWLRVCVCAEEEEVAAVNTNLVREKTNVFNPWLSCPVFLFLPPSLPLSSLSLCFPSLALHLARPLLVPPHPSQADSH